MNLPGRAAGFTLVAVIAAAWALQACQHSPASVVAVSGTVIGVEIGENPANQTFQGKLGYNRSEVAIVPTNKCRERTGTANSDAGAGSNSGSGCQSTGNGAADSADVLMELHYNGIFSKNGGIYQRLAVGKTAVTATPTLVMFATPVGSTSNSAAQAQLVQAARAQVITENEKIGFIVKCYTDSAGTGVDHARFDPLVAASSIPAADKVNLNTANAPTPDSLREKLSEESNNAIAPLYEAMPATCKP